MQVKTGGRLCLDAVAVAEPIEDLVFHDYYSRTHRIRLTGDSARSESPETTVDVVLDGNDVTSLVGCAITHPSPNMRQAVLTAIWHDAESFRQIFRFGLQAPASFHEIRQVVAEELARHSATLEPRIAQPPAEAAPKLLPRMPPPAHLKKRGGDDRG